VGILLGFDGALMKNKKIFTYQVLKNIDCLTTLILHASFRKFTYAVVFLSLDLFGSLFTTLSIPSKSQMSKISRLVSTSDILKIGINDHLIHGNEGKYGLPYTIKEVGI